MWVTASCGTTPSACAQEGCMSRVVDGWHSWIKCTYVHLTDVSTTWSHSLHLLFLCELMLLGVSGGEQCLVLVRKQTLSTIVDYWFLKNWCFWIIFNTWMKILCSQWLPEDLSPWIPPNANPLRCFARPELQLPSVACLWKHALVGWAQGGC